MTTRLPNVHPSDLTKWPKGLGTFDIGAASEGSKILMYNETPLNLQLDFLNGSTDTLHAWEANWWLLDGDTKQVQWAIDADSLNVATPPINAVFLTLYGSNEILHGQYPMALVRQANVGNTGGIATSNVAQVINDGNPLQQVVEAKLTGHSSSDVIINNDGSYTLTGAGVIALAGVLTHILGSLTVEQVATFTGNIIANGGMNIGTIRDNSTGASQITLATAGISILNAIQNDVSFAGAGNGINVTNNALIQGILSVNGLLAAAANVSIGGNLQINIAGNLFPSATSGSAALYQFMAGTLKLVLVLLNGWQKTTAGDSVASIPTPFTSNVIGVSFGCGPFHLNNASGVNQTVNVMKGFPTVLGGAGTVQSGTGGANDNNIFDTEISTIAQVGLYGSQPATSKNGMILLIGA